MITRIDLENWKSFGGGEVHFDPVTVVIGANDSGKSNLVEALWFLSELPSANSIEAIFNSERASQIYRGSTLDVVRRGQARARLSIDFETDELGKMRYAISLVHTSGTLRVAHEGLWRDGESGDYAERVFASAERDRYSEGSLMIDEVDDMSAIHVTPRARGRGRPKRQAFDRSRSVLAQIILSSSMSHIHAEVDATMRTLASIQVFDPTPSTMRGYSKLADELQPNASNIAGFLAHLDRQRQNEVESRIAELLDRLLDENLKRVYAEPVPPVNVDAQLLAEVKSDPCDVSPVDGRLLSDGTLRFVAIAAAVLTAPTGSLVVLEEIDNGLHASKAGELASFIKQTAVERGVDLCVTAHSATLLDALGPEIVQFTYVVHRSAHDRVSRVSYLYDLKALPRLIGSGGLGASVALGRLAESLSPT